MTTLFRTVLIFTALLISGAALAQGASLAHLDLMRVWQQGVGTPNREGFLPVAEKEAKTALLHANLALDAYGDPVEVNRHLGHVVHALDPAREAEGPGLGFGLTRAAAAILAQMQVATTREDASPNVDYTGPRVMDAADHVVQASREARILADEMRDTAGKSKEQLATIRDYIGEALSGRDRDEDGEISPAEAGLVQIREELALLLSREGF